MQNLFAQLDTVQEGQNKLLASGQPNPSCPYTRHPSSYGCFTATILDYYALSLITCNIFSPSGDA